MGVGGLSAKADRYQRNTESGRVLVYFPHRTRSRLKGEIISRRSHEEVVGQTVILSHVPSDQRGKIQSDQPTSPFNITVTGGSNPKKCAGERVQGIQQVRGGSN